jgi:hypothetical protein
VGPVVIVGDIVNVAVGDIIVNVAVGDTVKVIEKVAQVEGGQTGIETPVNQGMG